MRHFKSLTVFAAVVALALCSVFASKPSEAQTGPAGAGWYFYSICAYYGTPTSWMCGWGPWAQFGPYTSETQCTQTVQLFINTNSVWATDPYAVSNCFYLN